MKARFYVLLAILLSSPLGEAMACAVCSADPRSSTAKSMATAIWFLMAAVMSVLGAVGLFSLHLYKRGRMPLEPHQQITDEDLRPYE
ncbi:MAG TPA: hypothetical protein VK993_03015 [Chthoniobacterales bacterium]|nr:hypothetical protein [Chthoniobacterales bacterium]